MSGTFRCVISLKPSELREDNRLSQDRTAGWLHSWKWNLLIPLPETQPHAAPQAALTLDSVLWLLPSFLPIQTLLCLLGHRRL